MSERRHAILVGNAVYAADRKSLPDLSCPLRDVGGLAAVLENQSVGGFSVKTLYNRRSSAIKTQVQTFLQKTQPGDTVLFYYSGHGKLDDRLEYLHLCASDTKVDLLESTAVDIRFVQNLLRICRAEKTIILLDCCFSGAASRVRAKGDLNDQLRLAVRGSGSYLMTASDATQTAKEKEGEDYGVFTKHVIAGLSTGDADHVGRGYITMDDLYDYVARAVYVDSQQRPVREVGGHGDIVVAKSGKDPRKGRARAVSQMLDKYVSSEKLDYTVAFAVERVAHGHPDKHSPADRAVDSALNALLRGDISVEVFEYAYQRSQDGNEREPVLDAERQARVAEATGSAPDRRRGPGTRKEDWIANQPRRVYDDALPEEIPPDMLDMLDMLSRAEDADSQSLCEPRERPSRPRRRARVGLAARGRSLHIGLNGVDASHYEGWDGRLTAAETDAQDLAEIVARATGYESSVLLTASATRTAVVTAISEAAASMGSRDIFLITYSGYGGQVPDFSGDEGPDDFMDETLCLYDGQLIDDEIYALWTSFPASSRVVLITDCSYFGTSRAVEDVLAAGATSDNPELWPRAMPRAIAARVARRHRDFYSTVERRGASAFKTSIKASVRLIAACQDNQVALDGRTNGLFTTRLLDVWDEARFKGNYSAFIRAISSRMPPSQTPNHFLAGQPDSVFDGQRPFEI